MAFFRRIFRPSKFADVYFDRLIKADGNGGFHVDNNYLKRSLEAVGIPGEYANTVKQAAEEMTNNLKFKVEPQCSEPERSLSRVVIEYVAGTGAFYSAIDLWRTHSRFFQDA